MMFETISGAMGMLSVVGFQLACVAFLYKFDNNIGLAYGCYIGFLLSMYITERSSRNLRQIMINKAINEGNTKI